MRILGAGGHAKVAIEVWRSAGGEVAALHDDNADIHGTVTLDVAIEGNLDQAIAAGGSLHIAIGDNRARVQIAARCADASFPLVMHRRAWVSPSASIGCGTLVCAGAIVQAEAWIGRHAILNTLCLVEHDVRIGDFCHVAPGARLGGGVQVGEGALIGIGAIVLPGISVGAGAIVGAGAVVTRDVSDRAIVVGSPAHQRAP